MQAYQQVSGRCQPHNCDTYLPRVAEAALARLVAVFQQRNQLLDSEPLAPLTKLLPDGTQQPQPQAVSKKAAALGTRPYFRYNFLSRVRSLYMRFDAASNFLLELGPNHVVFEAIANIVEAAVSESSRVAAIPRRHYDARLGGTPSKSCPSVDHVFLAVSLLETNTIAW